MSSIHQDKWFMWLDTNCNLPENFKATTICNSPLENTGLFYADNSLKRTSRVPPSIYAKPDSGIWKRSACGFGLKYSPLGMQNPPAFEIWNHYLDSVIRYSVESITKNLVLEEATFSQYIELA